MNDVETRGKCLRSMVVKMEPMVHDVAERFEQAVAMFKTDGMAMLLSCKNGRYAVDMMARGEHLQTDPKNRMIRRFTIGDEYMSRGEALKAAREVGYQFWMQYNHGPFAQDAEKLVENFEWQKSIKY